MRAQLTIFMILGILMLLILGFVFLIPQSKNSSSSQLAIGNPVQQLLSSCLSDGTVTALRILASQGAIYQMQGGTANEGVIGVDVLLDALDVLPIAPKQQARVKYWNKLPGQAFNSTIEKKLMNLLPEIPEYPFEHFPFVNEKTNFSCSCDSLVIPQLENEPSSLQDQLERFIESYMHTCAVWQTLNSQKISVIEQERPSVQVRFAEQDTTSILHWQLKLSTPNGVLTMNTPISVKYPVRLRTIYERAVGLLGNDSKDLLFDVTNHNDENLMATRQDREGDDIISITDAQSQLKNTPYSLRFARHNRPPALWQINQTLLDQFSFCPESTIRIENNSWLMLDNACKDFPNPLVHNPPALLLNASDPDSDGVHFQLWVGGRNKGEHYVVTSEDIDSGSRWNQSFQRFPIAIRASDGHLVDYQILNITSAFPKSGTTGLLGTTGSFSGIITIPGVPITATVEQILLDDCGGLVIGTNKTFENRPCGDTGGAVARGLNGVPGHIGNTQCPSATECDEFRPKTQVWMLLNRGETPVRIDLFVDSHTGTPDAWTAINYVYLRAEQ